MATASRTGKFDIAARQAEVLEKPRRIEPLPQDECAEIGHELMGILGGPDRAKPIATTGPVHEFTAVMVRHPRLARAHFGLAHELFRTELPFRDRELAILRVGWHCRAPFEWSSHVKIGKTAGLTTEEIIRVQDGSAAAGWSEHDRALLKAVEELIDDAAITDATWAVLAKSYNEAQLIELPILVGQYLGVAFLQNSIRTRVVESSGGLNAE